jgi:hypothetical protein
MVATDLTGQRFGMLVVTGRGKTVPGGKGDRKYWWCQCDCGSPRKEIREDSLKKPNLTQSCGCLQRKACSTHGKYRSRAYKARDSMIQRCNNPNNKAWDSYGGRGITVCDRWLESFENFYADMGDPPKDMTIERKDNNLGYSPDNCKWATPIEQQNNKRSNTFIEFYGERLTVSQLAKKHDLDPEFLRKRLKAGWDIQEALTKPSQKTPKLVVSPDPSLAPTS